MTLKQLPEKVGSRHQALRDIVCDELRSGIISGRYPPGTRLVETHLANELGVSRNPVREALRVLQAEGFIAMVPRKGAVVAELDLTQTNDMFTVRIVLEGLAARLAASNASDQELGVLWKLVKGHHNALERGDRARMGRMNREFHELVLVASRNEYLAGILKALRGRMQWLSSRSVEHGPSERFLAEHVEMLGAIAARDEDQAQKLAEAHARSAQVWFAEQTGGWAGAART